MTERIIYRDAARAMGEQYYFTGEPCKYGHVAKRLTSNARCIGCSARYREKYSGRYKEQQAEYSREQRKLFPEKFAARDRARVRDKDLRNERQRQYYAANKEKIRAAAVAANRADPSKNRAQVRAWAIANPEKVKAQRALRRARDRGANGKFVFDDIHKQFKLQAGYCFGCFADLNIVGYHVDHIVPIARGGTNDPSNLQLLCPPCNCSKGAKDNAEWWHAQIKRRAK